MKILLAPSEAKHSNNELLRLLKMYKIKKNPSINSASILDSCASGKYAKSTSEAHVYSPWNVEFIFLANGVRERVLREYDEFLKSSGESELSSVLGLKRLDFEMIECLQNLATKPRFPAIMLYDGVAFRALDFFSLEEESRLFIEQNTLIFSNLFGVVLAGERIPFYRLKQGSGWSGFEIRKYHMEFGLEVAQFVGDELLLDLRAEYYHSSFTSKNPVLRPQFFKNGKKVSHYAKHYRGRFLRALAIAVGSGRLKGGAYEEILDCVSEGLLCEGVSFDCVLEHKNVILANFNVDFIE